MSRDDSMNSSQEMFVDVVKESDENPNKHNITNRV
jgi:hypothetical protein